MWLLQTKKQVLRKTRILSNISRFMYDLCTFSNDEFEKSYNDINPDVLKMKKENEDPCKSSFMDLSTKVHDRKFTTKLSVKTDAYLFYINCMPYLNSNITSKIFYASVGSKFFRIARTVTDSINMVHISIFC